MTIREFEDSMDYGVGYDSLSGVVRGYCVQRTPAEELEGGKGQTVFFRHYLVKSSSELAKHLELSASASINAKWFSEASAKARFLTVSKINQYSVYLLVQVVVTNSRQLMRDVNLTTDARNLLEKRGELAFRERSGDEFVVGFITGGEYLALLEVESKTEEQKREISALINAKAQMWNIGDTKAEFKKSMSELESRYSVNIKVYQAGGRGNKIPATVEEMVERAVNFPQLVQGNDAKPYQAIFSDYKTLDLPEQANLIDITHQKDVLINLWKWRLKYLETLSNIEYILQNSQQFEAFSYEHLDAKANEIRNLIDEITQSASNCASNITACKLPVNLIEPMVQLPQRQQRNNLQQRLRIEAEALAELGFDDVEFEQVSDGYGLVLPAQEEFSLVFFIPDQYPHQAPTVAMKTSSGLEEIDFENGTWQLDFKIADIVSAFIK
jgi:hypothetical protein